MQPQSYPCSFYHVKFFIEPVTTNRFQLCYLMCSAHYSQTQATIVITVRSRRCLKCLKCMQRSSSLEQGVMGHCCVSGMPGTAIKNFSCVIYNISLMNCTWSVGRDAPGDTQYFLYWENSREEEENQCELYVKDKNGRHIGCQFQNVTITDNKITYFIVNGSSKVSPIRFYDEYISLYKIERFMPPLNITANCDRYQTGCLIQWQKPETSRALHDYCFQYEVIIQYKDNHTEVSTNKTENRSYLFQNFNSKKRYRVKIRAAGSILCLVNKAWGEWSAPLEFGNEEVISPSILALAITAVATLLVAILTVLFCKRTGFWKAAFPQIPEPKSTFQVLPDTTTETEYKMQSITAEPEEIILAAELVK